MTGQYTNNKPTSGRSIRSRPSSARTWPDPAGQTTDQRERHRQAANLPVSSVQASVGELATGLITNKRSIESTCWWEDGSIVVPGGLLQDEFSGNQEKVPVAWVTFHLWQPVQERNAKPQENQPDGVPAAGGGPDTQQTDAPRWTATS